MLLIHALALSANNHCFMPEKAPTRYEDALGETWTHEIGLDRHADHLPSHRGRPHSTLQISFERTSYVCLLVRLGVLLNPNYGGSTIYMGGEAYPHVDVIVVVVVLCKICCFVVVLHLLVFFCFVVVVFTLRHRNDVICCYRTGSNIYR